jgi:N-acetylglucosaminyldiphosphoundecaprenol N-acetyl-beta-D-mannosaminyltransferase
MNRVKILNVTIDDCTTTELLNRVDSGVIFTPNVDHLVKLQADREFIQAYSLADYRVCDSKILFYISKFLGSPLKEKISGSDLFPAFYEHHKHSEHIKIFLLGAKEGVAARAQEMINAKVGRRMVVGSYSPSFGFENDEAECRKVVDLINQSGATVLAVGLGAPKQEKWICKYKSKLPAINIFLAIGATIDFEAGHKARAPKWVSELGLEWFFRLLSEPRRLWKRYLVDDTHFFWLILKQKYNFYEPPTVMYEFEEVINIE